ncbi:MAG: protein translocase subunit SecD [Gammaproteobacteria bacterium]|nr:protein translocase subunit SecD [Gammaproteobacteria bacterium]
MNRFPLWGNLLVALIVLGGLIFALPNVFGDDPALQITREDGNPITDITLSGINASLDTEEIEFFQPVADEQAVIVRFPDVASQLRASEVLGETLPFHIIALTLAPRTPAWLSAIGLEPMSLGLDLRGGVHFLYQVDLDSALDQLMQTYVQDLRTRLREATIRNTGIEIVGGDTIQFGVLDPLRVNDAEQIIRVLDPLLLVDRTTVDGQPGFQIELAPVQVTERQNFAIQQNTITLRNRVNELGVAEPVVQRQGLNRIVVQLPGVQDPAQAERILGATATLEFRLVDWENDPYDADQNNRPPIGSLLRYHRDGRPELLRRDLIVSGDQLTDASFGYSQGQPAVFVRLNSQGANRMLETTQANLRRSMSVLFIEEKPELIERDGEEILRNTREETVISTATIQGVFSNNFQITGITPFEGQDLALMLRAGALATPILKVEERTIGPSLGQDNIESGRTAVLTGFFLVVLFMAFYYRVFGITADLALFANLVLIVALLSMLQASLTLPGIAGIVLTVGMAVDANVLIFERIREELRNGNSPQSSIRAGYEKAFSTIADANITTLIAACVLFVFGTGPIRGFATTLGLGIMTSMFTAIIGTRVVINLIYGNRQVERLAIGGTLGRSRA